MQDYMVIANMERDRKWRERAGQVPFLRLDPDWEIAVVPPFTGADARMFIRKGEARVSVYLDFDGRLGAMDEPYWEVYPVDGDTSRHLLNDADGLVAAIRQSFAEQEQSA
jgi:hypothetical protein